jgi:hypothetical protein
MRRLGVPFESINSNPLKESIAKYINLVKRVAFFNTFIIHNDLHGGNFVFNRNIGEFYIIDMGETQPCDFDFNYTQANGHWTYGIERLRTNAAQFISHLNSSHRMATAHGRGIPYWRTRADGGALVAGEPILNDNGNATILWNRLWGAGGELRRIFDFNARIYRILTNATIDLFMASPDMMTTTMWTPGTRTLVRCLIILCSHPNPLLRPLPCNIAKLLSKVIKRPQDSVRIHHGDHIIYECDSSIGESASFDLVGTNWTPDYSPFHPASVWQTTAYLRYMLISNYYGLCYFLANPFNAGVNTAREIGQSVDSRIFTHPDNFSRIALTNVLTGKSRAEYQALELAAIRNIREILVESEPHLVIANPATAVLEDHGAVFPAHPNPAALP